MNESRVTKEIYIYITLEEDSHEEEETIRGLVFKILMKVSEAREAYQDRTKWRSIVSVYPKGMSICIYARIYDILCNNAF